jgi:integrase
MGKKNLKAQLQFAIQSCFKGNGKQNGGFGASKHSDMATGQKNGKIYSWSSYHSRVDVACQFSAYVKENYPHVREARQLTKEMAESFLLSKSSTCTTETLDCYRSNLASLGENINRTYGSARVDLKVGKVAGTTANQETRCKPMTDAHISALRDSYKVGSTGHTAVTIASAAGCRASEIVRLKKESIEIKGSNLATVFIRGGKGNRDRTIQVTDPQGVKALADIKALATAGERLVPCKVGSIQKSLNRHMAALSGSNGGSMKNEYKHTGFHAIRKNFAQKEFDRHRQNHTRQESLDHVSKQLGHGAGRDLATLQRYVDNIY